MRLDVLLSPPGEVHMARGALSAFGTSVFSEMTQLARVHGAVNLAQGFPDFDGPAYLIDAAADALRSGHNQYGRSMGVEALVEALARDQERRHGLRYDAMSEVCTFHGATEGVACALLGLLEPGDEVLLFEPCYDAYAPVLALARATPRPLTLRFPDFALDVDALKRAVGPRTRMVLLNTPHNPTGKVFTRAELEHLAALCRAHDLLAVTDEVYEHLCYAHAHVPLATLPGMRERTLSVSSAGKTFSLTGWKVGWCTGPAELVAAAHRAHQFLTFCGATPLHTAVAQALARVDHAAFLTELRTSYLRRRDMLFDALSELGFVMSRAEGGYFLLGEAPEPWRSLDDVSLARLLVRDAGVAVIPPSGFYLSGADEGRRLLRFAFCKREETLWAAIERLRAFVARAS